MEERTPAHVWIVLSAGLAVLGTSAILIRYAASAPGPAVAVWRTVFAVLLLAPVAIVKAKADLLAISRREHLLIGAAGVLLGLHFLAWIESLYHTSVASASVLVTTSPIFIAVLAYIFLRERIRISTVFAILVAVVGAALIGIADSKVGAFPNAIWGNGLAVSAALLFAVYLLIGRAVRQRISFLAYLLPLYAVSALTCLFGAFVQGVPLAQPPSVLGLCLLMALGPQLLGHGAFNYAVRYIPAALIGLLTLTEPIGASLLALLLFGEVPPPLALFGMIVVICAIGFVLWRRSDRAPKTVPPS